MKRYKRRKEYKHLSDEELLAILLLADQIGREKGIRLELHPGEKALAEEFLRKPKKLKRFLRGMEDQRTAALVAIMRLLNRTVIDE